jgi:hypothetical protein
MVPMHCTLPGGFVNALRAATGGLVAPEGKRTNKCVCATATPLRWPHAENILKLIAYEKDVRLQYNHLLCN